MIGKGSRFKVCRCPKDCTLKEAFVQRGWRMRREPQHQVHETRDVRFTVGYPQWSKGVEFTSRFYLWGRGVNIQCELCGKGILSGLRAPIEGTTQDGKPRGLWVGLDCAHKFTGTVFQGKAIDQTEALVMEREFKKGLQNS